MTEKNNMAYAIMRLEKLSGMGSVAASLQHCHRERETSNADPDRSVLNEHLVDATSTDEAMGKLRERLPEKRRKDAVLAVEYMMSASPDWWQTASTGDQHEFFKRSLDWLTEKYGKQNIITATVHLDELTPHLSAYVVPLTVDGRLSAKEFIGNRTKMSNDQTTFAERVQSLGLIRGIEGSKATHQRVKAHYGALQQADKKHQAIRLNPEALKPKTLAKSLLTKTVESPEEVAERINDAVNQARHPDTEKVAVMKHQERKAMAQRKLLEERSVELAKFKNGLSEKQVSQVLKLAEDLQQQNRQEKQEKKQHREKQRQQNRTRPTPKRRK